MTYCICCGRKIPGQFEYERIEGNFYPLHKICLKRMNLAANFAGRTTLLLVDINNAKKYRNIVK